MYASYLESNMRARRGRAASASGGGTRSTIAWNTSSTPVPSFADTKSISSRLNPNACSTSRATRSGSAASRSILFTTGMISRSFSSAR